MTAGVDPARLRRALGLEVEPLGPGAYRVSGGSAPHVVRGRECDCADARFNGGQPCKHRAAAYLFRTLHPAVRAALRTLTTKGGTAP
jgi:hypothetical protein